MDAQQLSSQQISSQPGVSKLQNNLLRHFQELVALAPTEDKDRQQIATQSYSIQLHSASIIRHCEDLLSMTRALKEAWLFGQLGADVAPIAGEQGSQITDTDRDAVYVAEYLRRKIKEQDVLVEEQKQDGEKAS